MYTDTKKRITVEVCLGTTPVGTVTRKPCKPRKLGGRWTVSIGGQRVTLRDPHGAAFVCVRATPTDLDSHGYA